MSDVVEFRAAVKKKHQSFCAHWRLLVDPRDGSVECDDCGRFVNPSEALKSFANIEERHEQYLAQIKQEAEELRAWNPWLRVAKAIEKIWRGGRGFHCPHCNDAIYQSDLLDKKGLVSVRKSWAVKKNADGSKR